MVREGGVRCAARALRFINLLLRLCGWLRACLVRLSLRLLRGGCLGAGSSLCLIVTREFVIDRGHFEWHFIPGVQQYWCCGLQGIYLVIPGVGAETAAQRECRDLIQLVLIQLRSALLYSYQPGLAGGVEHRVAQPRRVQSAQLLLP